MHQVPGTDQKFRQNQKNSGRCRVPGSRYLPCTVKSIKPKLSAKPKISAKLQYSSPPDNKYQGTRVLEYFYKYLLMVRQSLPYEYIQTPYPGTVTCIVQAIGICCNHFILEFKV